MPRTTRRSVKQRLQYIQVIQELQEEIKLLQISNEKLNGEGLDGLSYTELASLETMLKEGCRIVEEQTDKAQQELLLREIVDCDVMGKEWLDENENEDLAYQSLLARRRTAMRNKARELRLSPQDSQKEHSYNHETLMLTIECLKIEKERLRLLNQRMIGKELDGMVYLELLVFSCAIHSGMFKAEEEKNKIKRARQILGGIYERKRAGSHSSAHVNVTSPLSLGPSPVSLVPFDFGNNRYRQISGGAIIFFVTTSYYPTLQALLFAVTAY
ncbi:hypothetical protein DY000_02035335 [Brassica cretica]|uniref:K-box domain-containing protein n=2 Tax=Brassica TaxID=3705 RepID=A0ABQ7DWV5_BRACR|nr:hypothetical protein DY000_02035335 [Brassica cretica]